jgi:hypothetical protein
MNSGKKLNILDHLKQKNVKRFSLFFIVAFVFLIFSKLSNDYKQTIKLKVELFNVKDEILLKNDSSNFINIYVEAKGFSLVPFQFKKYNILKVNAKEDVTSKGNHFVFDVQKHKYLIDEQLGSSFNLLSLKPDTLLLPYSKRASKMVAVTLKKTISYAVGFDLKEDFKLSSDSVKIVGSSTEIDKINSVFTENLELKDINNDIEKTLNINVADFKNIEVFPKKVTVSGSVARFTEGTIEVPISIKNQPNDVTKNYFPKTVTVVYYVDLEHYNTIKPKDFIVECNYAELKDNQTYLVPRVVSKPKIVKYTNIKQKRIDFIIL